MKRVGIDVPPIPYRGSHTDQWFFREVAEKLRKNWDPGGSNVRNAVAALLDRVSSAMDESMDLSKAPDGRSIIEELTYAERCALPPAYHQPVWDGMGTPHFWLCTVCWDDGLTTGWPCEQAEKDGLAVARAGGLQYHY